MVGGALAYHDHKFVLLNSVIALFCSLLIQVGTNLTNDLYDYTKGADTKERIGPARAVNSGWVTIDQMKLAVVVTFGSAFFAGLYLVYVGGVPIFIIGVLSILSGFIYTAGPYPLAYNGLGEVFSFLFFGIVGTMGTYFVNALQWSFHSFLVAFPVGALITAILVVNNFRDAEQDEKSGKRTLTVLLGKKFTITEYIILLMIAGITPIAMKIFYFDQYSYYLLLTLLSLPLGIRLVYLLLTLKGSELNSLLECTARYSLIFGILFSLGLIL
jgi:1,4-dihydroxy-2-naphthoate octaprenyltransferase